MMLGDNKEVEVAAQENDLSAKDPRKQFVVRGSVDHGMLEKMSRSLVGESVLPLKSDIIPCLFKDWHCLVEVKSIGSFNMVLTFDSMESKVEALLPPFLLNFFGEVRDWSENDANRSRIA
ncbi:hypothetical protein PIB30_052831 [Stylosanthes scabra]|uniref:Uncharacterized protein n=1 Tax=Stylosanthes scabra TaxID=79078 RepID=A0ABU6QJ73_9FABA|nr:hypothetical protein [Stylosanthes scabra]